MDERTKGEVNEAIEAARKSLRSLRAAQDELGAAKNWGIVDMLGGGLFTNLAKHSKMNRAQDYIETAKADIRVLERELGDIPEAYQVNAAVGSFLSCADFLCDGLFVDYLVQTRIGKARENIQEAINKVERLLRELERADVEQRASGFSEGGTEK